jgi:hypothetical protein
MAAPRAPDYRLNGLALRTFPYFVNDVAPSCLTDQPFLVAPQMTRSSISPRVTRRIAA